MTQEENPTKKEAAPAKTTPVKRKLPAADNGGSQAQEATIVKRPRARPANQDPSPPTLSSRPEKPAAPTPFATRASAKMRKASDEPAPDADVNVPSTIKELKRKAQSASRKTRSRSFSRRWRQSISRGHHLHAAACKRPANKDPSPPTTRSRSEKPAVPKAITTTATAKVRKVSDEPAPDADVNIPSTSKALPRKAQRVILKTPSRSSSPSDGTSAGAKAALRRHRSRSHSPGSSSRRAKRGRSRG